MIKKNCVFLHPLMYLHNLMMGDHVQPHSGNIVKNAKHKKLYLLYIYVYVISQKSRFLFRSQKYIHQKVRHSNRVGKLSIISTLCLKLHLIAYIFFVTWAKYRQRSWFALAIFGDYLFLKKLHKYSFLTIEFGKTY